MVVLVAGTVRTELVESIVVRPDERFMGGYCKKRELLLHFARVRVLAMTGGIM